MDNQHRKIKGYKELDEDQIELMNQIKSHGIALEMLVTRLMNDDSIEHPIDKRWVAIGKTHLQQGLMALTRSVANPDFF